MNTTTKSSEPSNAVIAHTLQWLAVLLEIDDAEAERVVEYRHAAQTVRGLDLEVSGVVEVSGAAGLERLGLAPAVSTLVCDWLRTGELPLLGEAHRRRPGLWPALTRALCDTLGIEPATLKPPRRSSPRLPRPAGPIHRQVWESWN